MRVSIKEAIKKDPVIRFVGTLILVYSFLLAVNLGLGITVNKKGIHLERDYFEANAQVVILFILIVVVIIRYFWIQKERPAGKQVSASITGTHGKKHFWEKDEGLFLELAFDMDGKHFEREVFAEYTPGLVNILEKGATTILVKDPDAEKIILLELYSDTETEIH